MQAVMDAGPLLQTLLMASSSPQLPQWRHPPPGLESLQLPITNSSCGTDPNMSTTTLQGGNKYGVHRQLQHSQTNLENTPKSTERILQQEDISNCYLTLLCKATLFCLQAGKERAPHLAFSSPASSHHSVLGLKLFVCSSTFLFFFFFEFFFFFSKVINNNYSGIKICLTERRATLAFHVQHVSSVVVVVVVHLFGSILETWILLIWVPT